MKAEVAEEMRGGAAKDMLSISLEAAKDMFSISLEPAKDICSISLGRMKLASMTGESGGGVANQLAPNQEQRGLLNKEETDGETEGEWMRGRRGGKWVG